ncbi:spermidine acetyltransferase [Clostridia bacterium]|nr:spermidine acetyltransferase [Clostridia bacterium]
MKLIDIKRENWLEVIFLTTNSNNSHTLTEEFVASNAISIVQSVYEESWTIKAIENDGALIGFAMYGFCAEHGVYELCRIMIAYQYQGNGYGQKAMKLIIEEMIKQFYCDKIYLSTDSENVRGKHLYEKFGFAATGELWRDWSVI